MKPAKNKDSFKRTRCLKPHQQVISKNEKSTNYTYDTPAIYLEINTDKKISHMVA